MKRKSAIRNKLHHIFGQMNETANKTYWNKLRSAATALEWVLGDVEDFTFSK